MTGTRRADPPARRPDPATPDTDPQTTDVQTADAETTDAAIPRPRQSVPIRPTDAAGQAARAAAIARIVAAIGPLSPEQRHHLALLLPPPARGGPQPNP